MLKSMTGYGSESFEDEGIIYLVEIHSVNKKNLEITLYIPKDLLFLDIEIRKLLSSFAYRGQLTLKLSKDVSSSGVSSFLPDKTLLKTIYDSWKDIALGLNYPLENLSLEFIADQADKLPKAQKKDPEDFKKKLFAAIKKAGDSYIQTKQKEASHLRNFFTASISSMRGLLESIQHEIKSIPQMKKEKFQELFKEFDLTSLDLKEKIAKEVVLYVDRYDVTEEIHRLEAHLKVFERSLENPQESVGRSLEFLVQEMHRETNTLGSKSQSLSVTNAVLQIKSEIEKIREQVQNLE